MTISDKLRRIFYFHTNIIPYLNPADYAILILMNTLFLAVKAKLDDYDTLKSEFSGIIKGKWARDEDLHVTICYFGTIYTIEELLNMLPRSIEKTQPSALTSLDFFSHNKILYAKPEGYALDKLHASLCTLFPLKSTASFTPHVTLMRMKKIDDTKAFKEVLNRYKNRKIGKIETTLELMQNCLSPEGSKYKSIKKFE
ncbi:hypothetical protein FJR47_00255 [Sulfurimonas xiamenensis]|uniref:2'-5' RNA ligase n=2 Tax=Sulfurimonas xiamenensis TaxID=2590021 RepID=A0AAJ4DLX6_9BACT|nr:hypothetical protein FJR47_00255 [Sulfurimonas xiamenensis]